MICTHSNVRRAEFFKPALVPFSHVPLSPTSIWKEVVQQIALLDTDGFPDVSSNEAGDPCIGFAPLIDFDPVRADRAVGVCAVPLYEFSEEQLELFIRGDVDGVNHLLLERGVHQYFFPPPDQLTLALAERGPSASGRLQTAAAQAPTIGHPFGTNELLPSGTQLSSTIDELAQRGLLAEGEFGYEVTREGQTVRGTVRFRPREGLIAKLSRLFSVKAEINLKDLLK